MKSGSQSSQPVNRRSSKDIFADYQKLFDETVELELPLRVMLDGLVSCRLPYDVALRLARIFDRRVISQREARSRGLDAKRLLGQD